MCPHTSRRSKKISSTHLNPNPLTLNDLPENVIDEILVRLPIRTAVRTSLTSRFWHNRWKSIPDIICCDYPCLPDTFISKMLLLHSGPVRKFVVVAPKAPSSIDCWLVALSCRSFDTFSFLALNFTQQKPPYRLHSSIFALPNLTTIILLRCSVFLPPDFRGFKHLRNLTLVKVSFPNGTQLSSLIFAAPSLESLRLEDVEGRGCLKICSPSIRLLVLHVSFDDLALGSTPLLERSSIALHMMGVDDEESSGEDGDGNDVQWLYLGRQSSKIFAAVNIPKSISLSFDHLLVLHLVIDFANMRSISASICLLRSCPNLNELTIKGCFKHVYGPVADKEIWDAQLHFGLFPKLRTVKMLKFMFKEPEMNFVQLILETTVVLEEMVMTLDNTVVTNKNMVNLLEFRRASNKARILCTGLI